VIVFSKAGSIIPWRVWKTWWRSIEKAWSRRPGPSTGDWGSALLGFTWNRVLFSAAQWSNHILANSGKNLLDAPTKKPWGIHWISWFVGLWSLDFPPLPKQSPVSHDMPWLVRLVLQNGAIWSPGLGSQILNDVALIWSHVDTRRFQILEFNGLSSLLVPLDLRSGLEWYSTSARSALHASNYRIAVFNILCVLCIYVFACLHRCADDVQVISRIVKDAQNTFVANVKFATFLCCLDAESSQWTETLNAVLQAAEQDEEVLEAYLETGSIVGYWDLRSKLRYCWWFRNPAPVDIGSFSHYLQGFIHPVGKSENHQLKRAGWDMWLFPEKFMQLVVGNKWFKDLFGSAARFHSAHQC